MFLNTHAELCRYTASHHAVHRTPCMAGKSTRSHNREHRNGSQLTVSFKHKPRPGWVLPSLRISLAMTYASAPPHCKRERYHLHSVTMTQQLEAWAPISEASDSGPVGYVNDIMSKHGVVDI